MTAHIFPRDNHCPRFSGCPPRVTVVERACLRDSYDAPEFWQLHPCDAIEGHREIAAGATRADHSEVGSIVGGSRGKSE